MKYGWQPGNGTVIKSLFNIKEYKMRAEIKNRIEQIRQGKVPAGYKKAGGEIFPGDWTTASIETLYTERKESGQEGLPVLSVSIHSGVSDKSLDKTERGKEIKRIEDKTQYKKVYPGDLIFNMMRAWQGGIGVASVQGQVSPAYIVAQPNDSIFPYYMNYYMKMPQMIGKLQRRSYGVTDFRLRLYWKSFVTIMCHLPDLREQKCIAAILETQDRVIALREKLLAEKLRQKQYLMQVLLTGKKRLPGFSEPWKEVKLGDVFSERTETNHPELELLAITGTKGVIPRNQLDLKDNSSEDKSKYLKIGVGDIGYNTMRMWQGVSAYSNYEGIVSPAYTILKPNGRNHARFFAYLFKLPEIIFLFYRYSQGLVDDTRNLKYSNFKKIRVKCPVNEKEQMAIADILVIVDREINLLKQELEEERRKKKALMQLLLSGIVRVKP